MSEHTHGPWHWHNGGDYWLLVNGPIEEAGQYPSGRLVISDGSAHGEYGADLDPEGPDGLLIAAAPNLLAACEADAAFWDHFQDCRSCAFLNDRRFCDVGQAIREQAESLRATAISRATGETP